jgi:predicted phosphate transport protein (TIGR00153 family)
MLFSKGRGSMQDLLLEHARLVMESVDSLQKMVESLRTADMEGAEKYEQMVEKFETDADEVHRKNVSEICRGSFFGYLREDILQFMELADNAADNAKKASRALTIRKVPEKMLSKFITDTVMDYVRDSTNTARSLIDVIRSLNMKRDVIIEKVRIVEELEEHADTLKNRVFRELYSGSDEYDTLTVLQLREFIDAVDDIADNAEDASDIILVMLAKGYS